MVSIGISVWDEGLYDDMRASADYPIGIFVFYVEAQSIVAKMEEEMIGVSHMHGHGLSA